MLKSFFSSFFLLFERLLSQPFLNTDYSNDNVTQKFSKPLHNNKWFFFFFFKHVLSIFFYLSFSENFQHLFRFVSIGKFCKTNKDGNIIDRSCDNSFWVLCQKILYIGTVWRKIEGRPKQCWVKWCENFFLFQSSLDWFFFHVEFSFEYKCL